MNYRIFMDTQSEQFLTDFDKDPDLRPVVGDTIKIRNLPTLYKITRQQDNTLSSTPPVSIDYFVRIINTSPDTITMKKDIANFTRTMRFLGR